MMGNLDALSQREFERHAYGRRLLAMLDAGQIKAGQMTQVHVYHEDGCALYGGGHCDCEPTIEIEEDGRRPITPA